MSTKGSREDAVVTAPRLTTRRLAFLIPLKARSACLDWELAQANLHRTVRSVLAAAGDSSLVFIACHDEPDLSGLESLVEVDQVPFPAPSDPTLEGGQDKARKRWFAAARLRARLGQGECYVMFLDADDLVHRDLPEYVIGHDRGSYLLDQGYTHDASSGLLWRVRSGFHLICGSSLICAFRGDELPLTWDDRSSPFRQFGARPEQRGHAEYSAVAAELGRPSARVPFPAVVYLANHSESRWGQRTGERRKPPALRDLMGPRRCAAILRDEFGAPDLAARAATLSTVTSAAARTEVSRVSAAIRKRL